MDETELVKVEYEVVIEIPILVNQKKYQLRKFKNENNAYKYAFDYINSHPGNNYSIYVNKYSTYKEIALMSKGERK